MRLVTVTLCSMLAIAGCESHDRMMATKFETKPDGTWTYRGIAGLQYPIDTPAGEQSRIKMLEEWLSINGMCKSGYEIVSRRPVKSTEFVWDVYYDGRCR